MRRSLAAILSLSLLALAPAVAAAGPREDARATVERHFAALAAGDAKAVRAEWSRSARVTSIDAAGVAKKQTLSTALSRWLEHPEGLTWEILKTRSISEREVELAVRVTWNGATFDDTLRVAASGKKMLISRKSSRPHTEAKATSPSSGY